MTRRKPSGCHNIPFHVGMWQHWLSELNREADPELQAGVETMRHLLQLRDIGNDAFMKHPGKTT